MACFCHCLSKCCFWRTEAPYDATSTTISMQVLEGKCDSKMSKTTVMVYQILAGIRYSAKKELTLSQAQLPNAMEEKETLTSSSNWDDDKDAKIYNIQSPSRKGGVIVMKDYDEALFREIRKLEGISAEEYDAEWDIKPNDIVEPKYGAGRSGSLFFWSVSKRFFFKMIPHHEVQTLRAILSNYRTYIQKHPDSRLMRFFALHRFRIQNDFIYLFVGNNCFYSPRGLSVDVKYDLKGRKAKDSSLKKKSISRPADGSIWKDNQLNRQFYPDNAVQLVETLAADAKFLASQRCIDYSLLVGVHKNNKKCPLITQLSQNRISALQRLSDSKSSEKRYSFSIVDDVVGVGLPSTEGNHDEVYFFGIIDFLSRYFTKKKAAHYMKRIRWESEELSTVNPEYYQDRFTKYVPTIIKVPDDKPVVPMRSVSAVTPKRSTRSTKTMRIEEVSSENIEKKETFLEQTDG